MIDSEQNIELIEKYLSKVLTKSEELIFYEKMKDPDFELLVQECAASHDLFLEMVLLKKREALRDYIDKKSLESKSKKVKAKRIIIFTLIGVMALVLVYTSINTNRDLTQESKSNFKSYEAIDVSKFEKEKSSLSVNNTKTLNKRNSIENKKDKTVVPIDKITNPNTEVTVKQSEEVTLGLDPLDKNEMIKESEIISKSIVLDTIKSRENRKNNDPCEGFLFPRIEVIHSCSFREGGQIYFSDVKEGFSILYKNEQMDSYDMSELEAGSYSFIFKYNECMMDTVLSINEVPCFESEELVLKKGESLEIEFSGIKNPKILILDKMGKELLRAKESSTGMFVWDGHDASGRQMLVGLYSVVVFNEMGVFIKNDVTIVP